MNNMDFRDIDRILSEGQAELRAADALSRQLDNELEHAKHTVLNPSYMDAHYPLPKSNTTQIDWPYPDAASYETNGHSITSNTSNVAIESFWVRLAIIIGILLSIMAGCALILYDPRRWAAAGFFLVFFMPFIIPFIIILAVVMTRFFVWVFGLGKRPKVKQTI